MRSALATFSIGGEAASQGRATAEPMTFSAAEIEVIIKAAANSGDSSAQARWAAEMQRLLQALPNLKFPHARATPLGKLCAAGTRYGWSELERNVPNRLLAFLSGKAKASLRLNLQRDLE